MWRIIRSSRSHLSEMKTPNPKTPAPKFTSLATAGAKDQSENGNVVKHDKKTGKCPMCTRSHSVFNQVYDHMV